MGALDRAHAVKAARDAGREINLGTLAYPVLMAADILLYDSDLVPVGKDQKQHVEMARDMALSMNHHVGREVFHIPEPLIREEVATVPGLDGRKMSKSYGNTVELFSPPKVAAQADHADRHRLQRALDEPKDPSTCNVFALYKLFADADEQAALAAQYAQPGFGYGHAKQALFEVMDRAMEAPRARYEHFAARPDEVEDILFDGARRARAVARSTLGRVREAIGLNSLG
jgi:tryptophanyl-tRNA synthetase